MHPWRSTALRKDRTGGCKDGAREAGMRGCGMRDGVPRFVRRAWKHTIVQCLRMFPELNALLRMTSALGCLLPTKWFKTVRPGSYPFHVHRSSLWVQLETSMKNPQLLLLKMRMRIQAMQGGAGEYILKTWVMPMMGWVYQHIVYACHLWAWIFQNKPCITWTRHSTAKLRYAGT